MVEHAGVKILLGGDATPKAWEDIYHEVGPEGLKADVFHAPHHGSKHNINKDVFEHIKPEVVIVSVVEGTEYAYSYYDELATGKNGVFSTKYYGNITLEVPSNGNYDFYADNA